MRKHIFKEVALDFKLILVYLFLTIIFLTVPPLDETMIRKALVLPLLLFVPGYVLIAAFFPGKNALQGFERFALSFGFSIAVVPILGLGISFTSWGMRSGPMTSALVLFILSLSMVAHFRRLELPADERFELTLRKEWTRVNKKYLRSANRADNALTIILIFSIMVSFVVLFYVLITSEESEKFTELYILGQDGKLASYPREAGPSTGTPLNLIVGIANHEHEDINYTLRVQIKDDIYLEEKIQLSDNQTWKQPVSFKINETGRDLKLMFLLYRDDQDVPYRKNHLWVNSK